MEQGLVTLEQYVLPFCCKPASRRAGLDAGGGSPMRCPIPSPPAEQDGCGSRASFLAHWAANTSCHGPGPNSYTH